MVQQPDPMSGFRAKIRERLYKKNDGLNATTPGASVPPTAKLEEENPLAGDTGTAIVPPAPVDPVNPADPTGVSGVAPAETETISPEANAIIGELEQFIVERANAAVGEPRVMLNILHNFLWENKVKIAQKMSKGLGK